MESAGEIGLPGPQVVPTGKEMRMARLARFISGLALLAMVVSVTGGCAAYSRFQQNTVGLHYPHARAESLTRSPHEHYHQVSRVSATDRRALIEDLDLLFLTERTTRLSRWHAR